MNDGERGGEIRTGEKLVLSDYPAFALQVEPGGRGGGLSVKVVKNEKNFLADDEQGRELADQYRKEIEGLQEGDAFRIQGGADYDIVEIMKKESLEDSTFYLMLKKTF